MADVAEHRPCRLTTRITTDDVVLHESHEDVLVLPGRHWLAQPAQLAYELLPAFVMPNDPAVMRLMAEAADLLKARDRQLRRCRGTSPAPSGSTRSFEEIYDAAQARKIRYAMPPASWGRWVSWFVRRMRSSTFGPGPAWTRLSSWPQRWSRPASGPCCG